MTTSFFRHLATAVVTLLLAAPAGAQDVRMDFKPIADEFRNSCASCHGDDGKGGGFLTTLYEDIKPGDITLLAKMNRGVFPFNQVFDVIDGRDDVAAHGSREMPVWGDRYMYAWQCGNECGPAEMSQLEKQARARILELVYYIQSIQER
jgi:mono/diheme cytochrome c family protein